MYEKECVHAEQQPCINTGNIKMSIKVQLVTEGNLYYGKFVL